MRRLLIIGLCLCLSSVHSLAQSKSRRVRSLEKQRSDLQQRIKRTDEELRKVKQTSKSEQERLRLVRKQVAQRKEVIEVIGQEMVALQQTIDSLGIRIVGLRSRERHLMEQYASSVRAMQRRDSDTDRLLFLISAESLNEAMLRQKFLGSYALATSRAKEEIGRTRREIEKTQQEVNTSHEQKGQLLQLRNEERQRLEHEEGKRSAEVKALQGKEKQLIQSLETQRSQAQQLEQKIQDQILLEIRQAEERTRKAREARQARRRQRIEEAERRRRETSSGESSLPPQIKPIKDDTKAKEITQAQVEEESEEDEPKASIRGGYAMDAEERKLSGSFSQNKGRLPLPIRGRYDLVRRFGLQQHNVHSRVQVSSGGIDLRAYADKNVYAVFSGVVSRVFITPGYGQSIILRHGNYLTVYSNLSGVRVSQGQRVKTGQALGSVTTSGDASRANILHFQLWHERTKLNPEVWVKR